MVGKDSKKMKMETFDTLNEDGARKFIGSKVVDLNGKPVGSLNGVWMDPSTHRIAYVGVKGGWISGKVYVVPAKDLQMAKEDGVHRLAYPSAFVQKAPAFDPECELAQVEKEEINAYFNRFTPLQRVTSIEEIRPEETSPRQESESQKHSEGDRDQLERREQVFFNQKGYVTDAMPEVDANEELSRTQKEAKIRNREDRIRSGSLD